MAGYAPARLRQHGHAGGDAGRAPEDQQAVRRRAVRHGDARPARRLRADLGPPGAPVLAAGDPARSGAHAGVLLHGRGLLGPRMDDAAAGVRLRVRQAALRPSARGPGAGGARALPGGARLPEPARPLHGEPRRASRRGDVSARQARGRRGPHVPVAGPAVLPSRTARGPAEAHLAAPRPGARGARRHQGRSVLRRAPAGAPAAHVSRRPVEAPRVRAGVGGQRDVGRIHLLCLAGGVGPARPRRGELRAEPGAMLRPLAVRGPARIVRAAARPDERRRLRPERRRSAGSRSLSRPVPAGVVMSST